jgi:hypothetical protein
MTRVCLVNEANLAQTDFNILVDSVKHFAPLVTKPWGLPDVVITTVPTPGAWLVYVTDRKRIQGATGYHTFENGLPTAYCSPTASYRLFGHYSKPIFIGKKQLLGATYTEGLVTTICHELAEMLCDPQIGTLSAVDSKGRTWLVEVCDHVFGSYSNYVSGTTNCILPDVTTPSFYNLKGTAPFSLYTAVTTPFTLTKNGYGYYKTSTGQLVKL